MQNQPSKSVHQTISGLLAVFRESLYAQDIDRHMSLYADNYSGLRGNKQTLEKFLTGLKDAGSLGNLGCMVNQAMIVINGNDHITVEPVMVGFDNLTLNLVNESNTWLISKMAMPTKRVIAPNLVKQALESYYKNKLPDQNASISDVAHIGRDVANLMHSFKIEYSDMGKVRQQYLLLRMSTEHDLKKMEFLALDKLDATVISAPKVYGMGESIAYSFILMERMKGRAMADAWHNMDKTEQDHIWEEYVNTLVDIHRFDWKAAGLQALKFWEGKYGFANLLLFSLRKSFKLFKVIPESAPILPHLNTVYTWLEDNKPITKHIVMLHGDYHPGNVLVHQGEISAVVDWEAILIGDPSYDLCICLLFSREIGLFDGLGERLLNDYREISGRTLPNLEYYMVMKSLFLMIFFLRSSHLEKGFRHTALDACNRAIREHTGTNIPVSHLF